MEFTRFFKLLKKHKWGLMALPIVAMALTFVLVRKQPSIYTSQSRLSAGLTAGSQTVQLAQQLMGGDNMGDAKINQTFSNVTQTMKLKVVLDQVSYMLMLHDLDGTEKPFRNPSKLFKDVVSNPSAKQHAIDVYTQMHKDKKSLYLADDDQNGLNELLISMKYNSDALRDKLGIYRVENSDFIDVYYESDNALLSAYVVNTLCSEFISYYSNLSQQNKVKSTEFLHDLMLQKKASMTAKMDSLRDYKIKHKVMSVADQVKTLYAQIGDFETKLQMTQKDVESVQGAINAIDAKFTGQERQYMEARMALINQEIVSTQEQLNELNNEYIRSNFDKGVKAKLDAMKAVLAQKINQSTDKYIVNPLVTKENLIAQKLKLETDLALAKNSMATYRGAIGNLNGRLQALAPNEAAIQSQEADILVASKEYLDLQAKYDQSAMQLSSSIPIKVIEPALPGAKQPSKKIVLVALSGIASLVLYLMVLFVLFYLDDSIRQPADLFNKTEARVLGALPVIKTSVLDIQKLWNIDSPGPMPAGLKKLIGPAQADLQKLTPGPIQPANTEFKKMVRATRFEINMALAGGRNLVVTSLEQGEGKTLVSLSMVTSFQVMNKKVLIIDGNFLNPGITMMTQPRFYVEDYLVGRVSPEQLAAEGPISVLGNKGLDVSLFEINTESEIEQKLLELKDVFDIVFIETSALSSLNQAKEWAVVADRVMCVFEAGQSISQEMKERMLYLRDMDSKFIGWVLNKTTK